MSGNKHHAVRTACYDVAAEKVYGPHWHASGAEQRYCHTLQWRQRAGEISTLRLQLRFPLLVNGLTITTYVADFVYLDPKLGRVIVDVKGQRLPMYILKAKWMAALGQPITEVPAK